MASTGHTQGPKRKGGSSPKLWNILTILILVSLVCVACGFLTVFSNPYSALNPFPPPTRAPQTVLALPETSVPSATFTSSVILPPTWTPTNSPVPTDTPLPTSTLPPQPTSTPFTLTPTPEDTPIPPPGGYPFRIQDGNPLAVANIYHPELGCAWMGVAGQVFDMSGGPVTGLIIRLGGALPDVTIPENMMTLTGVALSYGRSGYEFPLADRPIASKNRLWLQLLGQDGTPFSDKVYFDTYDSCDKNLIIINFKQVR